MRTVLLTEPDSPCRAETASAPRPPPSARRAASPEPRPVGRVLEHEPGGRIHDRLRRHVGGELSRDTSRWRRRLLRAPRTLRKSASASSCRKTMGRRAAPSRWRRALGIGVPSSSARTDAVQSTTATAMTKTSLRLTACLRLFRVRPPARAAPRASCRVSINPGERPRQHEFPGPTASPPSCRPQGAPPRAFLAAPQRDSAVRAADRRRG
jgi:hypothetical protein